MAMLIRNQGSKVIPAQAADAVARDLAVQAWGEWEYVPDALRRLFLRDAKIALEAAAPHILGCDDALWHEFQAATATAGTNPSETIRQLVREWVNNNRKASDD